MLPAPPLPGRLARLADFAFRRRRLVLVSWIAVLVAAVVAGGALRGEWSADYTTPGSESKAAQDLLAERFPERSSNSFDVVWAAQDAAAPAARERVDAFLAEAATLEGVGHRR